MTDGCSFDFGTSIIVGAVKFDALNPFGYRSICRRVFLVGCHVYPAFAVTFSTAWSVDSFARRGLLNNRQ